MSDIKYITIRGKAFVQFEDGSAAPEADVFIGFLGPKSAVVVEGDTIKVVPRDAV